MKLIISLVISLVISYLLVHSIDPLPNPVLFYIGFINYLVIRSTIGVISLEIENEND